MNAWLKNDWSMAETSDRVSSVFEKYPKSYRKPGCMTLSTELMCLYLLVWGKSVLLSSGVADALRHQNDWLVWDVFHLRYSLDLCRCFNVSFQSLTFCLFLKLIILALRSSCQTLTRSSKMKNPRRRSLLAKPKTCRDTAIKGRCGYRRVVKMS